MTTRNINNSHIIARDIYEETEHLKPVDKPQSFAGTPLQQAYAGYKAQRLAYKALHCRDRITAAILVEQARQQLMVYKGEE